MNGKFWRNTIIVSFALLMAAAAVGQLRAQTYASVSGLVTDQSGAAVPGVALKLQNQATDQARTTSSDSAGGYAFTLIPPATYTLTATKSGFATTSITNVIIDVNAAIRRDITLTLSSVQQQVTVQASPVQVNGETADLGSIVESTQMVALPLNGRDFLQLAVLSAGVAPPATQNNGSQAAGSGRQTEAVNVSGTREVSAIVMFDGIPEKQFFSALVALQPPVDSLAEFKIQEGYFSPAFSAPAVINVVTKSGTNTLHGGVWEFLRNDKLNARNFFDINRPAYRQNQFGGNLGGRIIKNKVFWFGDYEGLRIHTYQTQYLKEPTAQMLTGDFSALSTPIYDPATYDPVTGTMQPFTGNIIPTGRISSFATAYKQFIPAPNGAPIAAQGGANLYGTVVEPQSDTKWDGRGDVDWSSTNRFFGRASRMVSSLEQNSINPVSSQTLPLTGVNIAFGWTHIFTPTIVNDFRAGLDRAFYDTGTPKNWNGPAYPKVLGLVNVGGIAICNGVSMVALGNYSAQGISQGNCLVNGNSDKLFIDNLAIVHGKHTITLGFNIRRVNWRLIDAYQTMGYFTFTGQYSGNSVADFLLGAPNAASAAQAQSATYRRAFWPTVYVNDTFHATSKLTVNYGVNWMYTPPPNEKYDNLFAFDFNQGTMVRCGTQLNGVGMPQGCMKRNWLDFSPRLGIAYSPAKDWAVRASYGVFWDRIPGNEWLWNSIYWPFQSSYSAIGSAHVPTSMIGLIPAPGPVGGAPNPGTTLFNLGPPNRKDPNIQQWTLSVEHTLPGNVFLELAYVGSKGTHLSKRTDGNLVTAPPALTDNSSVNSRRPYQPFGRMLYDEGRSNSEYEALQFTARKPVSHGLSFLSGFTYSKSLDNDSYDNRATRNYRHSDMDKGPSVYDLKYRLTAGVTYALPFGNNTTGATRQAAHGWQLSAIITDQTGLPFQAATGSDFSNTGSTFLPRPNRICDGNLPRSQQTPMHWFNTSCFVNPAQDTYGNGGVGYLRTDGHNSLDLSLTKQFTLKERARLEFRAEAFNALNNVNFGLPGVTVGYSDFGMVGSAEAPRLIQFGLKLMF